MKLLRLVATASALFAALALSAQDQALKIDREKSFVDVDVKATVGSFTGRLDKYQATIGVDASKRLKTAKFEFRFSDLKTGDAERDKHMLAWIGAEATGVFELGILALTPDGQGQANGKLTMHGQTQRIEFPVLVTKSGDTYTIKGETTLDYREWGLKVIRKYLAMKVDPEVKVRFVITGALPTAAE